FSEFPRPILKLPRLEFLDLSSNQLESLPSSITELTSLESLLLFDNNLTNLPENIGELRNVRCLWLGDNKLESLPQSIVELRGLIWSPLLSPSTTVGGNPLKDPPIKVSKDKVFPIEMILITLTKPSQS
ncbi:unnamed protein product, partial [Trichobilharzia regenti]